MIFVGIDIGLTGGIVSLDSETNDIEIFDVPIYKSIVKKKVKDPTTGKHYYKDFERKNYHAEEMVKIIKKLKSKNTIFVIEKVHGIIGDGAIQSFSLGLGSGLWVGIVKALSGKIIQVSPQAWKKELKFKAGSDKKESVKKAQELYPQIKDKIKLLKDNGKADALLLAEFGRIAYKRYEEKEKSS